MEFSQSARNHIFFLTLEQMHAACLWLRCHPRAPAGLRPLCYLSISIQDRSITRSGLPTPPQQQSFQLRLPELKSVLAMREFGTRTSFRPRPLDINRQLPIVRDLDELDSTEGLVSREITHNHEALDKENEEVRQICPTEWTLDMKRPPCHCASLLISPLSACMSLPLPNHLPAQSLVNGMISDASARSGPV